MEYLKFTDFRNKSKKYFDEIEEGNSFIIIRKGKPIAKISPFNASNQLWKREIKKIKLNKEIDSSNFVKTEREEK